MRSLFSRQSKVGAAATEESSAGVATIDPDAVMRIKNLQLRARSIVEGIHNGLHRSPYHGFSVEFSEYRPYSEGDDTRSIDWKLYARSDRYYIKRFEDETNRRCYLVLDRSRSMGYGSLTYTKIDYARTLAASLAYYLTLQRDSVGLLTFDESVNDYLPARHRHGHLHQLMVALARPTQGTGTNLAAPLEQIASLIRKRGLVVLISDLLADNAMLRTNLSYLRSRGHEVLILRVLDPAERSLPIDQPGMVVDMESGREIYLDPVQAAADYRKRFDDHAAQLSQVCGELGIELFEISTDSSLDGVLLDILNSQQQKSMSSGRRGALSAASMMTGGAGT
ncbi:MAG: DUF58 domain-containing protein [Planctomycetota bacterium]